MTNRDLALEYLHCFCGGNIDGLSSLLAADLIFSGTLHDYHSASDYLDSLRIDPPDKCEYNVLSVTEGDDAVAVFYEYQKPEHVLQIAQLFKIRDYKINEIILIFDARDFL